MWRGLAERGSSKVARWVAIVLFAACGSSRLASAEDAATRPPLAPVTIYEAARIITMEPALPTARFVAVADGIVVGIAEQLDELEPWMRDRSVEVDRRFARKVLLPGFVDPHVHPMQAAVMYNLPFLAPEDWQLPTGDFPGARTPGAFRARLLRLLEASDASPFIVWGHHALFHGPLDRAALDEWVPGRAIVVWQRSFHEVVMNSAALAHYGLDDAATLRAALEAVHADPEHASLAEGRFSETALLVALARMRPDLLSSDRMARGFAALRCNLATSGVTTVSDMGTDIFAPFETEAALIQDAFERPDATARVMLMPLATAIPADKDAGDWLAEVESRHRSAHVLVDRRVKLLADGAFFAQFMRMNPPGYSDGHLGKWITEPAVLREQLDRFWRGGFDLHVHVNGDEGLDVVLAGIEALPARPGQTITLEHLGYSTEAQNTRIARLGLMVSAQPNYVHVLGDAYAKHGLGPDRASAMGRIGSLADKGVPLALHSDFNMAPIDPLRLAWIAANRITLSGRVAAPAERLELREALRAITIGAARVIGLDAQVGSIASGKRADFVALDRDPYRAGAQGLDSIRVEGVVFEGRPIDAKQACRGLERPFLQRTPTSSPTPSRRGSPAS